ncbi:glutaminase [Brevibacillus agri]|uniref:Glutaminase n=1 Tax=Brevibacillus agri TaxID=51101 RepID=A0A3M8AQ40_9BACL|nr:MULTISPECIES: glutaminase A [Brevibacillus]ELK43678.1 glutaminase [Brevibacillus agri BAB-2500]EJL41308.1 glutaminase A [Brevibacillus sp. CF112]MBG9568894.1 glutaminase [Brevibacillus agri]MBY0051459.1 glutaminase A [Brevibacillus agri]MDN4091829.1 glutaminase A [Brevibacillus agri]
MEIERASIQLAEAVKAASDYTGQGKVAAYIPELAKVDSRMLGAAVCLPDGTILSAGDADVPFTLQSISKICSLIVALCQNGQKHVFERVGKEPTGDPFNSIIKLETIKPHKPLNPMINAGAIAVAGMIQGNGVEQRLDAVLSLLRKMTGNPALSINEAVYCSEKRTAARNRALAWFLKDSGVLATDVEETLDLYFRHCAIEVTAKEVARLGMVLAADGVIPETGERVIPQEVARICKTFMVTCGMYNASGEFAIDVGIPAKSGVAGGIMAAVPQRMGIGVFGPALDEKGNSVAGVKLLELLAKEWNLAIF